MVDEKGTEKQITRSAHIEKEKERKTPACRQKGGKNGKEGRV